MPEILRAPEIGWPSLSDLSSAFTSRRRQLDVLGRQVEELKVKTVKIGRERRVEPEGAVRLLRSRGLPAENARAWVRRVVQRRMQEVPAMAEHRQETATTTTRVSQGYSDPVVIAAAQRYAQLHRPTLVLPQGRADFNTDDLIRAMAAGQR